MLLKNRRLRLDTVYIVFYFILFFPIWSVYMLQLAWKQMVKMSHHENGMQTPRSELGPGGMQWLKMQCWSKTLILFNNSEVQALSGWFVHGVLLFLGKISTLLGTGPGVAMWSIVYTRCILVWRGPASPALHHFGHEKFLPAFVFFFP